MSEYGALLVENCIDRLLKTLALPEETNRDANWTIFREPDPHMLYSDVMPARNTLLANAASMVTKLQPDRCR